VAGKKRVLAIIPARSGSKGLENKNILDFNGKPLIAWSIEAARAVGGIDKVVLSTDSEHYANIGKRYGASVPFLRGPELSGDKSSLMSVIRYTVSELKKRGEDYDIVVVLQPTSPLRTTSHIVEALEKFMYLDYSPKSMASVYKVESKYRWLLQQDDNGSLRFLDDNLNKSGVFSRQANADVLMPNGAIFIYESAHLEAQYQPNTVPFLMSQASSIDVDSQEDFDEALKSIAK
jgi:CMP-N-acetylneuraminic acid synthetase